MGSLQSRSMALRGEEEQGSAEKRAARELGAERKQKPRARAAGMSRSVTTK